MFELSMHDWEYVLRAVVVYVVLLGMIRLSGKRTMGQFTPFDVLLIVLLGNAVQNSLLGDDHSLLGGLLLVATLIGLNWAVGVVSARSRKADRILVGEPVLLAKDGEIYKAVLRRENISQADFDEAMREADRSVTGISLRLQIVSQRRDEHACSAWLAEGKPP